MSIDSALWPGMEIIKFSIYLLGKIQVRLPNAVPRIWMQGAVTAWHSSAGSRSEP